MNKKLYLVIAIFILLQPILDMFVTIIPSFPINLIVRGLFFCLMIIYVLSNKKNFKLNIILISGMIIYTIYSIFGLDYSIINSLSNTLKLFYLPYSIFFFMNLEAKKDINKILTISLFIYLTIFIFSYVFDIGYDTYLKANGKIGYRGLFNSVNEISAILTILYYLTISYLKNKKIIRNWIL